MDCLITIVNALAAVRRYTLIKEEEHDRDNKERKDKAYEDM